MHEARQRTLLPNPSPTNAGSISCLNLYFACHSLSPLSRSPVRSSCSTLKPVKPPSPIVMPAPVVRDEGYTYCRWASSGSTVTKNSKYGSYNSPENSHFCNVSKKGFETSIGYSQLIQMTSSSYTYLFKKLICKFAYKRVTVFRVAMNEVDKSTTVCILGTSIKLIIGNVVGLPLAASTQTLIIRIRSLHSLTHTSSRLSVKPLSSARGSGSADREPRAS